MSSFAFTFANLRTELQRVMSAGYTALTCAQYVRAKREERLPAYTWINRIDVDFSMSKARKLIDVFSELDVRATFFLRLHAPEYNPFSFENYAIVRAMMSGGHEIGYHSEIMDQAAIWGERAEDCLLRDLRVMREMYGVPVVGVASHSGHTAQNNLDFWASRRPEEFGLLYEAYDKVAFNAFHESVYVSDSEWTRWKCYENGTLAVADTRSLGEHAERRPPVLYSLLHSDTYFDRHFYEDDR
jgi:hypothetical protein